MTRRRLVAAIDRLADAMPYGHLLASTEPEKLLNNAAHELAELRAKLAAVREAAKDEPCECVAFRAVCLACRIKEMLGDG